MIRSDNTAFLSVSFRPIFGDVKEKKSLFRRDGYIVILHLEKNVILELAKPLQTSDARSLTYSYASSQHQKTKNNPISVATINRATVSILTDCFEEFISLNHTRSFSSLAVGGNMLAGGDVAGGITLYFCWFHPQKYREFKKTTLQWHIYKVCSLCFSNEGSFLLSGGREGVLVIWHMSTGHKSFMPKLGGFLEHIERNPSNSVKYIISLTNNTIILVDIAKMEIDTQIVGVYPVDIFPSKTALGNTFNAVTSRCTYNSALNGKSSNLGARARLLVAICAKKIAFNLSIGTKEKLFPC
jgi:WD40 repeat protein